MRLANAVRLMGAAVALTAASSPAGAQITGTFNASGSASLSQSTPGAGQPVTMTTSGMLIATTPNTGIFSVIAPGTVGLIPQSVSLGTGAVNVPNFINIAGFSFSLSNISAGIFSAATCSATAAAGQTCSPAGTPFNLVNTVTGSTLSFGVSGTMTAPFLLTSGYTGIFTTQFAGMTYQQLLNTLYAGGTIAFTYSFSAQAGNTSTVPEPSSVALLATGLVGLVPAARRRMKL